MGQNSIGYENKNDFAGHAKRAGHNIGHSRELRDKYYAHINTHGQIQPVPPEAQSRQGKPQPLQTYNGPSKVYAPPPKVR